MNNFVIELAVNTLQDIISVNTLIKARNSFKGTDFTVAIGLEKWP